MSKQQASQRPFGASIWFQRESIASPITVTPGRGGRRGGVPRRIIVFVLYRALTWVNPKFFFFFSFFPFSPLRHDDGL